MFVRNFLSQQTPYNGLLLYHGLGTGKTCSSILVCEEMRTYYNQMGINKNNSNRQSGCTGKLQNSII